MATRVLNVDGGDLLLGASYVGGVAPVVNVDTIDLHGLAGNLLADFNGTLHIEDSVGGGQLVVGDGVTPLSLVHAVFFTVASGGHNVNAAINDQVTIYSDWSTGAGAGDLTIQGTVTFPNGWTAAGGFITMNAIAGIGFISIPFNQTFAVTGGGLVQPYGGGGGGGGSGLNALNLLGSLAL